MTVPFGLVRHAGKWGGVVEGAVVLVAVVREGASCGGVEALGGSVF